MPEKTGSILVIDDDEAIILTLRMLLRRHFAEIVTANTPQKLTQLLHQHTFHVVLLDMNFTTGATSGKEGFHWLRHVKDLHPEVQVILMTAYGDIDVAIRAMKEGATDFIIKPWDNDKLIDTVLNAFKLSHTAPAVHVVTTQAASEEDRIFMFLDLKSSTRIAEELGHVRYFNLLNDFFADISEPIAAYQGEIYQYVGDQVVVSWPLATGVAEGRCIACFFAILQQMEVYEARYQARYGLVPTFKAGMHYGRVSAGVIGTIKRETVYSGDVLNTTSRIEGLCNRFQASLLVSQDLLEILPEAYSQPAAPIGSFYLRGRQKPISLYSVSRPTSSPHPS
ncbi:MAG: hypothetical protein OHK0039_27440 [Bacteroidia bacterium]